LGCPPDDDQDQEQEEQPEPRHPGADGRVERPAEEPVEPVEDPPQYEDGDGDRRDDDEPGDEVTPDRPPERHTPSRLRRMASWRRHISLSRRSSPSGWS